MTKETVTEALIISIHALRGEGDEAAQTADKFLHISIHALRGEGDQRCAA